VNKNKKKIASRKYVLLLVSVLVIAGCFILATTIIAKQNQKLSAQEESIRQHLNCDRGVQDFRPTDIFCNQKFYRTPDVSTDDAYTYNNCHEVLDPDYNANIYYDADTPQETEAFRLQDQAETELLRQTCSDKKKLETARLEIVERLRGMMPGVNIR
jgi:hypothetical protein